MRMTFNQYIQNPMGIANSVISNREMYRKLYNEKFDKIILRETGRLNNMENHLYKDGDRYIAYLKIPSEVVSQFYYDVIIEFTKPKAKDKDVKKKLVGNSLEDYYVRFYSNDPSFVFTFCHAFVKNDMFFKEFSNKMSKQAIKDRAVQKNPKDIVGYVKSLYFAYILMSRRGLFNKLKYVEKYDKHTLDVRVMDADKKILLRQEEAAKLQKQQKIEKQRNKINRKDNLEKEIPTTQQKSNLGKVGTIGVTKKITTTRTTKTINAIKKSNKIIRKRK